MAPFSIVEHLNVFEHIGLCVGSSTIIEPWENCWQAIRAVFWGNKTELGNGTMKMIKQMKPAIATFIACLLTLPALATAADYYVQAGIGKNTNSGTQPYVAFADLAYAMPKLRAGDTLYVRTGTYTQMPNGSKLTNGTQALPITVKPYMNEKPVISAIAQLGLLDKSWWVFENLTFQNSESVRLGSYATVGCASFATDIVIKNSRFQHGSRAGIQLQCGKRITIVGNTFDNLRARIAGTDPGYIGVHGVILANVAEDIVIRGNTFRDIGADGIQIGKGSYSNITIAANTFEVIRPYVYRDLNGKATQDTQRFGNVGENAIDIKGGPGPINVMGNQIRGFRADASGQDSSGSMGEGIIIQQVSSGINVRRNHFYDNIFHMRIGGVGAATALPDRNVEVSNNIFEEVAVKETAQIPTGLDLGNVSGVQIYNNVFYNLKSSGKRLLRFEDVTNVSMQNNLFHNGQVMVTAASSVMDVYADQNAWSAISNPIPSAMKGLRDLTLTDPAIDWSTWIPKAGSRLIDRGMNVGILYDYYRSPMVGVAPDIGAAERQ